MVCYHSTVNEEPLRTGRLMEASADTHTHTHTHTHRENKRHTYTKKEREVKSNFLKNETQREGERQLTLKFLGKLGD